jgi:hypothetical protein
MVPKPRDRVSWAWSDVTTRESALAERRDPGANIHTLTQFSDGISLSVRGYLVPKVSNTSFQKPRNKSPGLEVFHFSKSGFLRNSMDSNKPLVIEKKVLKLKSALKSEQIILHCLLHSHTFLLLL